MNNDKTILVVDDGATNRKLYHLLLSRSKFTVITSISAQEALEKLQKIRPCLILIDVQLEDMNGLDLTQQLKSNPTTQPIPIIVMTAHYKKYDERQAHKAGANAFIPLPINVDTFVSFIHDIINTNSSFTVEQNP